jgi:DDE_Tnp_1-associated/Transposase DDE domain
MRLEVVQNTLSIFQAILPRLLKKLSNIPDPRNPKKMKHKLTVLLMYGLLLFVLQYSSRRAGSREISRPMFFENLKNLFSELETLPHQDTLHRLLKDIDVEEIQNIQMQTVREFIRSKRFRDLLIRKGYAIGIDGTQKCVSVLPTSEGQLTRVTTNGKTQYYIYVLEAKLIFSNGMVLPLLTEFLDNTIDADVKTKQDCELKAFRRLANRLKKMFPRLSITLLLDGLYANGPIMKLCDKFRWGYMIVLQDKALPTIWEEAMGLRKISPKQTAMNKHNGRKQSFWWVNQILYTYGENEQNSLYVNVVVCEETWEEVNKDGGTIIKSSKHAWLSHTPISKKNVYSLCNELARSRWRVENDILKEKRQGYYYEHRFSNNWNAMKGYHYLMHLAHFINELLVHSINLIEIIGEVGIRDFISLLKSTLQNPWFDLSTLKKIANCCGKLRLT